MGFSQYCGHRPMCESKLEPDLKIQMPSCFVDWLNDPERVKQMKEKWDKLPKKEVMK